MEASQNVFTDQNMGTQETESQEHESCSDKEADNNDADKSSDAIAKGLSTMLSTIIKDFDSQALHTINSQDQLNSALDRLTRELDQLLEDAPLPFIMQHATKISAVRKRVSSLNSLLKSIQRRIDNIDRMITVGNLQDTPEKS